MKYFEEVFTTEHWMVRIYRVLPKPNLDAPKSRGAKAKAPTKRRHASGARA
jgi:dolichyl-diphosphooligosaccharide--protein glycosyltransferase